MRVAVLHLNARNVERLRFHPGIVWNVQDFDSLELPVGNAIRGEDRFRNVGSRASVIEGARQHGIGALRSRDRQEQSDS